MRSPLVGWRGDCRTKCVVWIEPLVIVSCRVHWSKSRGGVSEPLKGGMPAYPLRLLEASTSVSAPFQMETLAGLLSKRRRKGAPLSAQEEASLRQDWSLQDVPVV